MAAPFRNTQVGTTVQLNTMGNSLRGVAQGTTVQLGNQVVSGSGYYRDPTNPNTGAAATNAMSAFRNRQLVYITGSGSGPQISLNNNGLSLYTVNSIFSSTTLANQVGLGTAYIHGGQWRGTGGSGGIGGSSSPGYPIGGTPGGQGLPCIEFLGGVQSVFAQQANIQGGHGGGGGGSHVFFIYDSGEYYGDFAGGGGGGGYANGTGGASIVQYGQSGTGSTGGGGGLGTASAVGSLAYGTNNGGAGAQAGQYTGQPGQNMQETPSNYLYPAGNGGNLGSPIIGASAITYQGGSHFP
jgi:hypothetical protein